MRGVVGPRSVLRTSPRDSPDRDEGTRSLEETPSISGSSEGTGPEAKWTARFYLSKVVDADGVDGYRRKYQIPEDVVLRIPESDEVACSSRYGDVAFYEADFNAGVRFPLQPLMRELLDHLQPVARSVGPKCLEDGGWVHGYVEGSEQREGRPYPRRVAFLLQAVPDTGISGASGLLKYASKGFEVDSGEPIVQQGMERTIMSLSVETIGRVSNVRRTTTSSPFVECGACLRPLRSDDRGMATAKLNREKLKKMMASQQDEANVGLWRKVPTLPRDASLACRRAKSCSDEGRSLVNMRKVNTDVIKVAWRSTPFMKGLTELTVIANRCMQWEEALLKQKVQAV
uniref:Uncharacterized protein n=1 Tax=Fagus sylvatica TaxID=28930 RepID=A0A2N9II43_FAGSY